MGYLTELSSDAVPVTAAYFRDSSLPEKIHNQLGGSLACRAAIENDSANTATVVWTAFHQSDQTAKRLLDQQAEALKAYPVSVEDYGMHNVKVNGEMLPCINLSMMD